VNALRVHTYSLLHFAGYSLRILKMVIEAVAYCNSSSMGIVLSSVCVQRPGLLLMDLPALEQCGPSSS
jgi:hypothetical protein